MSRQHNQNERFKTLMDQIADDEASLRQCFEDTPGLPPQALARIKARLRAESLQPALAHRRRPNWALRAGAVAAAIVLAAGAGLYYQSPQNNQGPVAASGPSKGLQASADTAGLDAFTASLPKTMSDEDPAVRELSSDLKELESQTAKTWDSIQQPGKPSAEQSGPPDRDESLACADSNSLSGNAAGWQRRSRQQDWSNG